MEKWWNRINTALTQNKLMSKVEAILILSKTVHISGSKNISSLEDMCLSSALISSSTRIKESFPCGLVNRNVENVLLVYQNSENSVFFCCCFCKLACAVNCLAWYIIIPKANRLWISRYASHYFICPFLLGSTFSALLAHYQVQIATLLFQCSRQLKYRLTIS